MFGHQQKKAGEGRALTGRCGGGLFRFGQGAERTVVVSPIQE